MQMINKCMFKPTYLYIKTHNKTKLKYFGKTIKNPNKYKGSGQYWLRHLDKNGNDVLTEILGYYTDKSECLNAALEFSAKYNIVESNEWANLRVESLDGGDTSQTENYKKSLHKISEHGKKCRWWNNGIEQCFKETPPDESYKRGRLRFNNVGAKLGALVQQNKHWVNNGIEEMMIPKIKVMPNGYKLGRLKSNAFAGGTGRHSSKNTHWWTNGKDQKMAEDSPGPEWTRGRLKKS